MLGKRYWYDGKPSIPLSPRQLSAKGRLLWNIKNKYRMVDVSCSCRANEYEILAEKDRFGLPVKTVVCKKCGLVYQNPRLDVVSLRDFYSHLYRELYISSTILQGFKTQFLRGIRIRNLIQKRLGRIPRTVIDVGCGAGGVSKAFQVVGAKTVGVDYDEESIGFGIRKNLDLRLGGLERIKDEQAELIILSHVFEHFSKIGYELDILRDVVASGGFLYVELPGILNLKPYSYDFLRCLQNAHNYYFSLETLEQLLRSHGYGLVVGNESIISLFKYIGGKDYRLQNYYSRIVSFLAYAERMRFAKQMWMRLSPDYAWLLAKDLWQHGFSMRMFIKR